MKKSFRSLRSPNRKRKQASTLVGRPLSESDLGVSQRSGKYPGECDLHNIEWMLPTSYLYMYSYTTADPLPQGIIHPIVVQCVAYLNKESVLKEEGLFRIPGDVAVIKQLRERFINGIGSTFMISLLLKLSQPYLTAIFYKIIRLLLPISK